MSEGNRDSIVTLARQGGITLVGNISRKILGFGFIAVVTRMVSPSEYGVFTLGLSIVMFVQGFASLNIYRSIDYFIPAYLKDREYGRARTVLRNSLLIGMYSSSVGAIALFVLRDELSMLFDESELTLVLSLFFVLIPLQTLNRTVVTSFNSIKRMRYRVVMRDVLNPLGRVFAVVAFLSAGAGLAGLVGGYLLGVSVAVAFGIVMLFREADWIRYSSFDAISNRSLLSYSLPLVFAGVMYTLVSQIDYFVIGFFQNSDEVGYYRVGYMLAVNLLIVLTALTPVFKPMVSENRHDSNVLRERYRLATRWITILTIPLAVPLIVAPDVYLGIVFTEAYTVAGPAVAALAVGYMINAGYGPEGMILEGLGHTRLTLFNTVLLVGINAFLDFVLVPRFGILGAGIATGCGLTVAGAVGVLEIYLLKGFQPYSWRTVRVWMAGALAFALGITFVSVVNRQIVVACLLPLISAVSFLIGLRTLGGFTQGDVKLIAKLDRRLTIRLVEMVLSPGE
ncbi:oligosaccharide flippase family protein [Haloarchaeobius sp. HME9146]|uniref:oligosaccharide flippase family protein n=1 Tax=Haloarchaeobius sp. HME9146 TaxID=2978732 RepID=UPI0021C11E13|nr:oligosaccharide flippase family protein [Haloarchaeobius sp. HME9146]MCT9098189.1 oligosaccharide flippase family protein [Haloarchaeobius sp. HME9146]